MHQQTVRHQKVARGGEPRLGPGGAQGAVEVRWRGRGRIGGIPPAVLAQQRVARRVGSHQHRHGGRPGWMRGRRAVGRVVRAVAAKGGVGAQGANALAAQRALAPGGQHQPRARRTEDLVQARLEARADALVEAHAALVVVHLGAGVTSWQSAGRENVDRPSGGVVLTTSQILTYTVLRTDNLPEGANDFLCLLLSPG